MIEFWQYALNNLDRVQQLSLEHLSLVGISLGIALVIGIPLGILATQYRKLSSLVLNLVSLIYTIPSLAMFGLLLPLIGMGSRSAITALSLYSLLPIVQNTYVGITNIDQSVFLAAEGMGMSRMQILFKIELPLAISVIFAGIRTATVNCIGITTIAAFIGAGGLGMLVFRGLSSISLRQILLGSIPVLLMAMLADWLLKRLENRLALAERLKKRQAVS
ncbi:MAG: ABC transporter permease [Bacillota bacterium]|nr:ABC transporter permease [Bacillota bacterium]